MHTKLFEGPTGEKAVTRANLLSFASNKATDIRDNTFALLAISSYRTCPDDAPNYENSKGTVYVDTMKKGLEIDQGRELLDCAGGS